MATPRKRSLDMLDLRRKAEVLRDRQKRYGDVVIPKKKKCQACGKALTIDKMARIPYTGVVRNVMDCVCTSCSIDYATELKNVPRLACAGCREIIAILEPGKESRGGFVWEGGKCYHVAECPACNRKCANGSPVIEKLLFYKRNGIPYA